MPIAKIIVADTGPLIALAQVQLLPVMNRLFNTIYVTDSVIKEATHDATKPGAQAITAALKKQQIVHHEVTMSSLYLELVELLDSGEAETLALAKQLRAIALIDERRGRRVAAKHDIKVVGTAAVLIKAKRVGEITAVRPLLNKLTQCGYRFSAALVKDVLQKVGE